MTKDSSIPSRNIAVLGAGAVGRALAARWASSGHSVTFGVRRPADDDLLRFAAELDAHVTAMEEALLDVDVVLLAIAGDAMPLVVTQVGPRLAGKIVIDATNNTGSSVLNSVADIGRCAPSADVYRAFNTVGWENVTDPIYADITGDMLYCGPVGTSREVVDHLIDCTGLRPVYIGDNDKAYIADALTALWFALAFEQGYGRGVGFKILTR